MIGPVLANIFSNPTAANLTQNTVSRVAMETGLKSIGRPGFILIDKDISPQTKKYAATKEFLYQATCLAVYLLVIPPIFKNGSFALGKKLLFKNSKEFAHFDKFKDFKKILGDKAELAKYPLVRGTVELGSYIGSILGLAVLAPEVSHKTIHPLMRLIGMEKKPEKQAKEEKVDVKA